MYRIFIKELSSFFNSLIAYLVIGVFLLFIGLIFWVFPDTNILDYGYAEMDTFFRMSPYILLFFVPAITMRMFSEEAKTGTLELLLTKPVSLWGIIGGKFLSVVVIVSLALLPTLTYYFSIYFLGNPTGNIDTAAVIGSYFGLILLSASFASIGIFMSSTTKNQVVAFLLAICGSYILFTGFGQVAQLFTGSINYFLTYLGLEYHYASMGKGVLDSRDIIYYLSIITIFFIFTYLTINLKRK